MRTPRLAALAAVCWTGLAAPAGAELYSWTDAQGTVHFTHDLARVPVDHREAARERAREEPVTPRLQLYETPPAARAGAGTPSSRTLRIPFQKHGTLMRVEAELNGWLRAPFFVDTGASGIAIPETVASRLGLRVGPETRWIPTRTANGLVARPLVRLESVRVGAARVENLEATINPSLEIGLLGGAFFNNFVYRVDAAEQVITLAPNRRVRGGLTEAQWRDRFATLRQAIQQIDDYVPRLAPSQNERRAELAQRRAALVSEIEALEEEANRSEVPHAWRE